MKPIDILFDKNLALVDGPGRDPRQSLHLIDGGEGRTIAWLTCECCTLTDILLWMPEKGIFVQDVEFIKHEGKSALRFRGEAVDHAGNFRRRRKGDQKIKSWR